MNYYKCLFQDELKIKASKAVAAKERKAKGGDVKKVVKKEKDEFDEFDAMSSDKALNKSLSGKLGQTPDGIVKVGLYQHKNIIRLIYS